MSNQSIEDRLERLFTVLPEVVAKTNVEDDALRVAVELEPGLWRCDLSTHAGGFDCRKLNIRCGFRGAQGDNVLDDPAAPETGPWDYINGDFVIPRAEVLLDGTRLPLLWFSLPGIEDCARNCLRASFGFEILQPGIHQLEIRFSQISKGLAPTDFQPAVVRPDERFPFPEVPALRRQAGLVLPCDWASASLWRSRLSEADINAALTAFSTSIPADLGGCVSRAHEAAFYAALLKDARFTEIAMRALAAATAIPHWGPGKPGDMGCDIDMGAGNTIYLLSCAVAWLRLCVEESALSDAVRVIRSHADILYRFGLFQRNYWPCGYFQNHSTACHLGLLAAGLLLDGESESGQAWAAFGKNGIDGALALLSPDGGGIPLDIDYGMFFVMQACDLWLGATGENIFQVWQEKLVALSEFRRWNPAQAVCGLIDRILCARLGIALPARAKNGVEREWSAEACRSSGLLRWSSPDGMGTATAPVGLQVFANTASVTYCQQNTGGERVHFYLRCGPVIGTAAQEKASRYHFAHGRPDCGVLTWSLDDTQMVGPAMASYRKMTNESPVAVFDGLGQWGEGAVWMPQLPAVRAGRLMRAGWSNVGHEVICELTAAYPPERNIRSYVRTIQVDNVSGRTVIEDEAVSETAQTMSVSYHTAGEIEAVSAGIFRITLKNKSCILEVLGDAPVTASIEQTLQVVQYTYKGEVIRHIAVCKPFSSAYARIQVAICPEAAWHKNYEMSGS